MVVDGSTYDVDCLIFATGFEVGTDYSRRSGFELVGHHGLTLTEKLATGYRSFHGLHIHGFPNALVISTAQAGFTVNFSYVLDVQAHHAAWVIAHALERSITELEATEEAEEEWVTTIVRRGERTSDSANYCTPGYYNNEGQADQRTRQSSFYLGGPTEYADLLAAWRAAGSPEGLVTR